VAPGTTRGLVVPLLEKESNLKVNDFFVAFSPERVDPVNKNWNLSNTPKIISGINHESSKKAFEFYSEFIDE
jgi:UDP-N-acetyl-D-glucosamine dehydrogenase